MSDIPDNSSASSSAPDPSTPSTSSSSSSSLSSISTSTSTSTSTSNSTSISPFSGSIYQTGLGADSFSSVPAFLQTANLNVDGLSPVQSVTSCDAVSPRSTASNRRDAEAVITQIRGNTSSSAISAPPSSVFVSPRVEGTSSHPEPSVPPLVPHRGTPSESLASIPELGVATTSTRSSLNNSSNSQSSPSPNWSQRDQFAPFASPAPSQSPRSSSPVTVPLFKRTLSNVSSISDASSSVSPSPPQFNHLVPGGMWSTAILSSASFTRVSKWERHYFHHEQFAALISSIANGTSDTEGKGARWKEFEEVAAEGQNRRKRFSIASWFRNLWARLTVGRPTAAKIDLKCEPISPAFSFRPAQHRIPPQAELLDSSSLSADTGFLQVPLLNADPQHESIIVLSSAGGSDSPVLPSAPKLDRRVTAVASLLEMKLRAEIEAVNEWYLYRLRKLQKELKVLEYQCGLTQPTFSNPIESDEFRNPNPKTHLDSSPISPEKEEKTNDAEPFLPSQHSSDASLLSTFSSMSSKLSSSRSLASPLHDPTNAAIRRPSLRSLPARSTQSVQLSLIRLYGEIQRLTSFTVYNTTAFLHVLRLIQHSAHAIARRAKNREKVENTKAAAVNPDLSQRIEVSSISEASLDSEYECLITMLRRTSDHLAAAPFTASQELLQQTARCECTFAQMYCENNLDYARASLLVNQPPLFNWSTYVTGFRFGFLAMLTTWTLYDVFLDYNDTIVKQLLPIYRGMGYPIIWYWLWSAFLFIMHKYRINYLTLFDLDAVTTRNYRDTLNECVKVSTIFLANALICYKVQIGALPNWIPSPYFPVLCFFYLIYKLLFPLSFSSPWLISLLQVVTAPFSPVTFRSVFVGDVLTSCSKLFSDLTYISCFVSSGIWVKSEIDDGSVCLQGNVMKKIILPVVGALPLWFRFMQCLHAYWNSRARFPHLYNAGKYSVSLLVVFLGSFHVPSTTDFDVTTVLWIFALTISTLYTFTWDVMCDWNLMTKVASRVGICRCCEVHSQRKEKEVEHKKKEVRQMVLEEESKMDSHVSVNFGLYDELDPAAPPSPSSASSKSSDISSFASQSSITQHLKIDGVRSRGGKGGAGGGRGIESVPEVSSPENSLSTEEEEEEGETESQIGCCLPPRPGSSRPSRLKSASAECASCCPFVRPNHAFILREILMFRRPYLYYCAICLDLFLRFAWCLTLIPLTENSPLGAFMPEVMNPILASCELVRRAGWACFRLENEHLTHAKAYAGSGVIPMHIDTGLALKTKKMNSDDDLSEIGPDMMPVLFPTLRSLGRNSKTVLEILVFAAIVVSIAVLLAAT